jgi:hypothetical protein
MHDQLALRDQHYNWMTCQHFLLGSGSSFFFKASYMSLNSNKFLFKVAISGTARLLQRENPFLYIIHTHPRTHVGLEMMLCDVASFCALYFA